MSLALALPVFWVTGVVQAEATAVALTREAQAAITPARALERLKQGNERFVNGKTLPRDFLAQVRQTSTGQYPFAAIVSCLDSRIPPAIVFDRSVVLREMVDKGELGLVGAMYDVTTGKVIFYK